MLCAQSRSILLYWHYAPANMPTSALYKQVVGSVASASPSKSYFGPTQVFCGQPILWHAHTNPTWDHCVFPPTLSQCCGANVLLICKPQCPNVGWVSTSGPHCLLGWTSLMSIINWHEWQPTRAPHRAQALGLQPHLAHLKIIAQLWWNPFNSNDRSNWVITIRSH